MHGTKVRAPTREAVNVWGSHVDEGTGGALRSLWSSDPKPRRPSHRDQPGSPTSAPHADLARLIRIARRLLERMPEVAEDPVEFEQLIEQASVGPRAARRWRTVVGPVYTATQVKRLLDIDDEQIQRRLTARALLACRSSEGLDVFPEFQFDAGALLRGLGDVLALFDPQVVDGWTLSSWLTRPLQDLGERSIVDHLCGGGDLEPVLALAAEQARNWST